MNFAPAKMTQSGPPRDGGNQLIAIMPSYSLYRLK